MARADQPIEHEAIVCEVYFLETLSEKLNFCVDDSAVRIS
jgi:hypothetical protein